MIEIETWNGAGNDFVVVTAAAEIGDPASFAIRLCDPEGGVGVDGVLVLDLRPESSPVGVGMRLYQPDGSTAAMCGNGARCAAAWAADRTGATEVDVDTPAGVRRATVTDDVVTVGMGTPTFDPAGVPVDRDTPLVDEPVGALRVTAVNTGVPHAVAFVDDVDAVDLDRIAPDIRHAAVFPEGANVTVAAPVTGGYRQRTFERGVEGETVACGTGAVAIAAVARRLGRIAADEPVRILPPGGELTVTIGADGSSTLEGPVEHERTDEIAVP